MSACIDHDTYRRKGFRCELVFYKNVLIINTVTPMVSCLIEMYICKCIVSTLVFLKNMAARENVDAKVLL